MAGGLQSGVGGEPRPGKLCFTVQEDFSGLAAQVTTGISFSWSPTSNFLFCLSQIDLKTGFALPHMAGLQVD